MLCTRRSERSATHFFRGGGRERRGYKYSSCLIRLSPASPASGKKGWQNLSWRSLVRRASKPPQALPSRSQPRVSAFRGIRPLPLVRFLWCRRARKRPGRSKCNTRTYMSSAKLMPSGGSRLVTLALSFLLARPRPSVFRSDSLDYSGLLRSSMRRPETEPHKKKTRGAVPPDAGDSDDDGQQLGVSRKSGRGQSRGECVPVTCGTLKHTSTCVV